MFTLYLVEDEAIELDLLKEHIDWAGMGIRVLGSARNGKAAWEQILTLQPDIVLTDVRMPIMDGLQLASRIQERFEGMKTVFLSGHDEFAYVKSALTAGAAGYLLKPVDPDELADVMAKVIEEVKKGRQHREARRMLAGKQIEDIVRGAGSANETEAWQALLRLAPEYKDIRFASAIIRLDDSEALPDDVVSRLAEHDDVSRIVREELHARGLQGYTVRQDEYRWRVVVAVSDTGEDPAADGDGSFWTALSGSLRKHLRCMATIGIGDRAMALDRAGDLFAEAGRAVEESFYAGPGLVIRASQVPEHRAASTAAGLKLPAEGAEKLTIPGLSAYAEEFGPLCDQLALRRVPRDEVVSLAAELLSGISAELSKYEDWASMGIGEIRDWNRRIARSDTIAGIRDYVLDLLLRIRDYLEEKQQDRQSVLVRQVAELIDSRYAEALTIDGLAEQVYLSPNYLRALFKEKKGCTIHEYLTSVRMRRAVELLRDKSLKIHEVARRVGFDNTSYFCSFFYKTQGVTPNEYRKTFL